MSQFKIFTTAIDNSKAGSEKVSHEGGQVFKASDSVLFERFLILGTFGTFYASASELTEKHMNQAVQFCTQHPEVAMDILEDVVSNRLAFRRDPSLFALAALSLPHIPIQVRRKVADVMDQHVITGTDILHWAAYRKALGGKWNKTARKIVVNWFLRPRKDLALQAVKYQQRDGWSLRDLLRLAHPTISGFGMDGQEKKAIIEFIAHPDKRMEQGWTGVKLLDAYNLIRADNATELVDEAVQVIRGAKLPREAMPSELLQRADVWDALLDDMPAQALMRNLGKLTSLGVIATRSLEVCEKIIKASDRLHPMQFLVTWNQYAQGKGEKGKLTWTPNPHVLEALEMGYAASFGHLPVIENVKPLIALDVSGSMTGPAMGLNMSRIAVEICMVEVLAKQFPNAVFAAYSNAGDRQYSRIWQYAMKAPESLPLLNVQGKSRYDLAQEIERYTRAFAGTDCAIPLRMAEKDSSIDAVISITDSETGHGESPAEVMKRIHAQGRTEFRHAVVALALNDISIADPNDVRQMDAVGASANLPQVLASFLAAGAESDMGAVNIVEIPTEGIDNLRPEDV